MDPSADGKQRVGDDAHSAPDQFFRFHMGDQIGVLRGCHGTLPSGRVDQHNALGALAAPVKHGVSSDDRIAREVFEHLERLHFLGDLRGQIQGQDMRGNAVIGPLRGNRCAERLGLRYRVPRRVSALQRRIATKMASGEKLGYAYPRGMPEFLRLT